MKEKIYTIPVNDAFSSDCECPICVMYKTLEDNAVDYTMGPSYMEDDIRAMTDEMGFCEKHVKMVYGKENRLGMALVLKTHFDKTIKDVANLSKKPIQGNSGLLKKTTSSSELLDYLDKLNSSCFVCNRINNVFERYIDTVLMLYKTDEAFREKYNSCKGFCDVHYAVLLKAALKKYSGKELEIFVNITNEKYLEGMKRVRDDLEWFINKFDYKYKDEPWKNAKDSLVRGLTKSNSILPEDKKQS